MSCVNILDNDTTLLPPNFTGVLPCAYAVSEWHLNTDSTTWATQTLRFKPDGTWEKVNHADNPVSTTVVETGAWIAGAFNPADYQIRITGVKHTAIYSWPAGQWGGSDICAGFLGVPPLISYDPPYDTGWLPLNSPRVEATGIGLMGSEICMRYVDVIDEYTVQIRQISNPANTVTGSGSLCARVEHLWS